MAEKNNPSKLNDGKKIDLTDDLVFDLWDIYPDVEGLLRFKQNNINSIKDDCLVALDANILLFPFDMDRSSLPEIQNLYKRLASEQRLIVPAHALREFIKHRSAKISFIVKYLIDTGSDLNTNFKKIGIIEENPFYIELKSLFEESRELNKKISKSLVKLADDLSESIGTDPVSAVYIDVFSGCVCELNDFDKNQNELIKELNKRNKLNIPPGNKDSGKEANRGGDFLIWKTILQEGASRGRNLIFVTADSKSDWFVSGTNFEQPRVELLDEYRRATENKTIHIVSMSKFLTIFKATENVIKETKNIEEKNSLARHYSLECETGSFKLTGNDAELAALNVNRDSSTTGFKFTDTADNVAVAKQQYMNIMRKLETNKAYLADIDSRLKAHRQNLTGEKLEAAEIHYGRIRLEMLNEQHDIISAMDSLGRYLDASSEHL